MLVGIRKYIFKIHLGKKKKRGIKITIKYYYDRGPMINRSAFRRLYAEW